MGMQAENWLSRRSPTTDQRECHPRSPLRPPVGALDVLVPPSCLAYIPVCYLPAARQSQSGSITITQQLCVFVEDYIFKRTLGEEEGVRKVVWQTMKVLTQGCRKQRPSPPVTPLCGKINPHNTEQHGWLGCCRLLLSIPSVFPSLPAAYNHFHSLHATALGEKYAAKLKLYTRRLNTDTEWYVWGAAVGQECITVTHNCYSTTFSGHQMWNKSPFCCLF